jgi:ferredoxin
VHAVDEAQLLQWHGAGVRQMSLATAGCEACPSRPRQTLTQRLQTLNAALVARGAPGMTLRFQAAGETGPAALPTAATATSPPQPSRRAWLGLRSGAPAAAAAAPAPVGRLPALDRLRQIGIGPALWGVRLDPQRCDGCCACARLCPTGAIGARGEQGRETALLMDLSRCVGCGLCVDVCMPGALSMAAALGSGSAARSWPLAVLQCSSCGKNYRAGPATAPAGTARCPACLSLGVRHANRVVQASAPAAQGPAEPSS